MITVKRINTSYNNNKNNNNHNLNNTNNNNNNNNNNDNDSNKLVSCTLHERFIIFLADQPRETTGLFLQLCVFVDDVTT